MEGTGCDSACEVSGAVLGMEQDNASAGEAGGGGGGSDTEA